MLKGINHIKTQFGDVPIRISAQAYLIDFYKSLGFESVSEIYLEDDIPHVEMLL
jgi:ElaA protein